MKNIFKATFAVAAVAAIGMGSYKAYGSYVAANMSEEELLLVENVEALASGSENNSKSGKFAKDYQAGQGLYVTKIIATGNLEFSVGIGSRLSAEAAAKLAGKVESQMYNEYKMDCQPNMGCFTTCSNIEWRTGNEQTRLVTGCPESKK